MRAKAFGNLAGVMGKMAQAVELQFEFVEGQPGKARRRMGIENRRLSVDLRMAKVEILEHLCLGIRLVDLRLESGFPVIFTEKRSEELV